MEITTKTVVTHGGPFHADDIVACALARRYFGCLDLVRTRDEGILAQARAAGAVLVDVGGEYDPAKGRFDHHFKDSPRRQQDGGLYASAGLVAREIPGLPDWLEEFCRKVDLADTGTKVPGWTFSLLVHHCNPTVSDLEAFDARFELLVDTMEDLLHEVSSAEELEGRFLLAFSAFLREHLAHMSASERRIREAFSQEGPILEFSRYEPALAEVAHEAPLGKLYTIYPSPGGEWMVQQIPTEKGGFTGRKSLPAEWAGLRGTALDAVTGVEGCVFCHPGKFIGGHKTLEGARKLALLAAEA